MSFPNRTFCDVLEEMRTCTKTNNYSGLLSLVEELQTLGNRMEAALYDKKDLLRASEELRKKKKKLRKLEAKIAKLEKKK